MSTCNCHYHPAVCNHSPTLRRPKVAKTSLMRCIRSPRIRSSDRGRFDRQCQLGYRGLIISNLFKIHPNPYFATYQLSLISIRIVSSLLLYSVLVKIFVNSLLISLHLVARKYKTQKWSRLRRSVCVCVDGCAPPNSSLTSYFSVGWGRDDAGRDWMSRTHRLKV